MSRTKKNTKPPGHEYWGKREISTNANPSGTKGKRVGIQRERARGKRDTKKRTEEAE